MKYGDRPFRDIGDGSPSARRVLVEMAMARDTFLRQKVTLREEGVG